jgi:hypothetical protein
MFNVRQPDGVVEEGYDHVPMDRGCGRRGI